MNRAERRNQNKKGNSAQPAWSRGRTGPQVPGAAKTNVQKGRHRVSQERGGAKK